MSTNPMMTNPTDAREPGRRRPISAELLKLRTTRAPYVAAVVAGAFAALVPAMATTDPERFGVAPLTTDSLALMLRAPGNVAAGAALIVAILAAAGEHAHGSALTSRLVQPDPRRILAAKVPAAAVMGAAFGVLVEFVALVVGGVGLRLNEVALGPGAADAVAAIGSVLLATTLAAVLGTALGALLRNTAAGVGVALVWVLAIERVLPIVAGDPRVGDWLPGRALDLIVAPREAATITPGVAAGLLVAYAVGLLAVTLAADSHRDA